MTEPHRAPRRARLRPRFLAVAALTGLAVLLPAAPALAGDPIELDGRYVVDEVGALDPAGQTAVQDAIDVLATEHGVNLFVVYTDEFDNPADRAAWAEETASLNQFGTNDVLLAVAVDDRVYQFSVDSGFALDDAQLATIENDDIVPALRDDDWAGAGVAAAEGLGRELGGSATATDTPGGLPVAAFFGIAIAIIIGAAVITLVIVLRRRKTLDRRATEAAAAAGPTQKELDQRVGAVLVDLDDAVTSSEEELGFAVAQFGAEPTAAFTAALAEAKTKRSEAFALKQKLDDAVPDTDEERRAWSLQIIELCDQASDALDAQEADFEALRAVERDPAAALAAGTAELVAVTASTTGAREQLTELARDYDANALQSVGGSIDQAEKLRVYADGEFAGASAAIGAGDTAQAALRIRAARQATLQAQTVIAAVATLATDLAAARTGLDAAVREAEQDLAELAALGPEADPALAPLGAALGTEVQRVKGVGARDPLAARTTLESVNAPLDTALAAVRGERERVARVTAQRDRAIATAQSEVAAASSFLQTRRGAVGTDARTRLSEAQRHLDQALALAVADPEGALREATTASQLAQRATSSARLDVSAAQDAYYTGSPTSGGGGSGDFGGAMLGGLLGSMFGGGGGGGRSSGWGGSSWGGSSWGGGSRGGSRSSWGGSSSRSSGGGSRRSSSRSSGGRRGGGGRF